MAAAAGEVLVNVTRAYRAVAQSRIIFVKRGAVAKSAVAAKSGAQRQSARGRRRGGALRETHER